MLHHEPASAHQQRQVILERIGTADLVAQAWTTHHHAAAVLRGILDAHSVLRDDGSGAELGGGSG